MFVITNRDFDCKYSWNVKDYRVSGKLNRVISEMVSKMGFETYLNYIEKHIELID
ncbi:MAG: hypothetical protein H8D97_01405 [Proteobacteria bacterium]|nr:hypothetical protein [Pseudomonadota bacterium]